MINTVIAVITSDHTKAVISEMLRSLYTSVWSYFLSVLDIFFHDANNFWYRFSLLEQKSRQQVS